MHQRTLFVFRQDLRIQDNTGLYHSCVKSKEVLPVFIFDSEVLASFPSPDKRLGFVKQAVQELDIQLQNLGSRLHVYWGRARDIIPEIIQEHGCDALAYNRSYGRGHASRDSSLRQRCKEHDIDHTAYEDYLLIQAREIKPYKVYTPYSKKRLPLVKEKYAHYDLLDLRTCNHQRQYTISDHDNTKAYDKIEHDHHPHWKAQGRRERLSSFDFSSYDDSRNIPSQDGSSKLSVYIRMGLISIRELYIILRKKASEERSDDYLTYVKELCRREFWHQVAVHFPASMEYAFQEKKRYIARENKQERWEKRCTGNTGYPMVDAGMRQLRKENWMHNRVRMIVASFLTKDALIDWRWGAKEFARYLLDHDHVVNRGNRQRSASVGADPKPLRIFNPMLQGERFDKDTQYIKKYIPELQDFDAKQIHNPMDHDLGYAEPMLDHHVQRKIAKQMYADSKQQWEDQHGSS